MHIRIFIEQDSQTSKYKMRTPTWSCDSLSCCHKLGNTSNTQNYTANLFGMCVGNCHIFQWEEHWLCPTGCCCDVFFWGVGVKGGSLDSWKSFPIQSFHVHIAISQMLLLVFVCVRSCDYWSRPYNIFLCIKKKFLKSLFVHQALNTFSAVGRSKMEQAIKTFSVMPKTNCKT